MSKDRENIRIQWWITGLSVVLFIAKMIAYILTHSVAILTDALESIVNVTAGFIGLYSLYISAKPRDADHPYGHGKIEFISAGIEGGMIFLAGASILYKALYALFSPTPIHQLSIGIEIIAATGIINFMAGQLCVRVGNKNNSLPLIASGKHLQSDSYSTIAVLAGLVLLYFTNLQWIDSAVAIIFSFFILYTGYSIVKASIAGIMDEVDEGLLKKLVTLLQTHRKENWVDLHNVRIIKYGSKLHLDCHLTVPWYLTVQEAHTEIEIFSTLVRREFDDSIELFVHADGCADFSCRICTKTECGVRKYPFEKRMEWTIQNIVADKKHILMGNSST